MGSEHYEELVRRIERKMGFAPKIMELMKELDPKTFEFYNYCDRVVQEDGALPAKFKMLIIMAMGAQRHCKECVVSAMRAAFKHGATREEVLEAIRVILVGGGAPAVAACRDALEMLVKGEFEKKE